MAAQAGATLPFDLDAHAALLAEHLTLVKPDGPGPFPVVLQMHGCGGIQPMQLRYAEAARGAGFAAVVVDSLGPRGIGRREAQLTVCTGARLRGAERAVDLLAMLSWVKAQPWATADNVAAAGWSHGFSELIVCRTLLGFFEAAHWPCALKTTFALLSEKDRTLGNSVLQSGASLGAVITPQIMKLLMTDEPGSWRTSFIVVGGVGFVWVALWFVSLRPRDLDQAAAPSTAGATGGLGEILRSGRFWAVALLIVGAQTVWHIYRVWLMKFLQTGRGYDETVALNFNSFYFIATDVGCLTAGAVSLWLIRRRASSPHDARRTVFAGACALTSLSILIPWLDKGWPLLAVLLLIGAGALALFPCFYSFAQEISATHVGRVTGLLGLWVWAVTSPMHSFFGMLTDRTKSYDLGLVLAGLAPWLGVISMKLLWRKTASPARP